MTNPSAAVRQELRRLVRNRYGSEVAGKPVSSLTMDELRFFMEDDPEAFVQQPDELKDPHQPGFVRRRYDVWLTEADAEAMDALLDEADRRARIRAVQAAFT